MSSTVKSLKVTYNPINEADTFTNGDAVSGQVALEVTKDCDITSLSVKFKGKARVLWSERHGNTTVVYHSKEKYFTIKHYFIHDKNPREDDTETLITTEAAESYSSVVAPGCHFYPFTFQIPFKTMPPSFKGEVGKIVYSLEAKLSRSMRMAKKDLIKITFIPTVNCSEESQLREPQHESKDKKMKLFNSGSVSMDVSLEKTGFFQGEGLQVLALIQNKSSREIKPKYCLYRKHSFFAEGRRRVSTKDLLKEVGEPIPPSAHEKVTRVINIPHDIEPSISDCSIIKVEHRLRVYLDVKYASDPEIKFPIVILRSPQVPGAAPFPNATGPFPNTTGPFPNAAGPFPNAAGSFPNTTGPFPNAAGPFPNAAGPFPNAAGPFPNHGGPYPNAAGPFPNAAGPYPAAAGAFGFGNTDLPQPPPAAPNPFDNPPPYGAYQLYPLITDFGKKPQ